MPLTFLDTTGGHRHGHRLAVECDVEGVPLIQRGRGHDGHGARQDLEWIPLEDFAGGFVLGYRHGLIMIAIL